MSLEERFKKFRESSENTPSFYCANYCDVTEKPTCTKQCFDCMAIVGERRIQTKFILANQKKTIKRKKK